VRLEHLRVQNFRNLRDVEINPDPRFNVVVGQNGQGKTNLVEAVYVLSCLKSFRALKNRELIQTGLDRSSIDGTVLRDHARRHVQVSIRSNGKRVSVNDKALRDLSLFFGQLNTVVFSPEDIAVLRGTPSDRRLLMDRMIFHLIPRYAAEIGDYETVLKNRNAVLKSDQPRRALIEVYDEQLAALGAAVVLRRLQWLRELRAPLEVAFAEIFDVSLPVEIRYEAGWIEDPCEASWAAGDDPANITSALRAALAKSWHRDLARGFTTVGPHRDDFVVHLGGQPVRSHASQGQQRALILAVKISEIRMLKERFGFSPILMLDDVSSELDPERNRRLFRFMDTFEGQVFITTTDASFIRLDRPFTQWTVRHGEVANV